MFCAEWTLVKSQGSEVAAKPLYCRSWTCEECAPKRKRQLQGRACSGKPTTFITLTVNPRVGADPEERRLELSRAWAKVVKRLRRLHGEKSVEYLAVAETTKRGEAHAHILARCPFIPQSLLSTWMEELIGAKIVDIRKVRNAGEAAAYVSKYLAKDPHQFGAAKRYWASRHYADEGEDFIPIVPLPDVPWRRVPDRLPNVLRQLFNEGYALRCFRGETLWGYLVQRGPPE